MKQKKLDANANNTHRYTSW